MLAMKSEVVQKDGDGPRDRAQNYWGLEVLQGALEVKNTITECGRLLNAELGV